MERLAPLIDLVPARRRVTLYTAAARFAAYPPEELHRVRAAGALIEGRFLGSDPASHPLDMAVMARYRPALEAWTSERVPMPNPLDVEAVEPPHLGSRSRRRAGAGEARRLLASAPTPP